MDFSLCSPSLLFKVIDYLHEECKLRCGGRFGYIAAILELIDFRKVNHASDGVLENYCQKTQLVVAPSEAEIA